MRSRSTDDHHLRKGGGLKIPVEVVIKMEAKTKNRKITNKYKQFVVASDKEPDIGMDYLTTALRMQDYIDSDEKRSISKT